MTCAYRREIHHAHVAIRDWLAGDSRADALDALMARFAEDFSMVTPHGVVLDKTALGELFRSKGGTRPGLRIEIDGESLLASGVDGATLAYREIQSDAAGRSERLSTVVLHRDDEGRLYWRHLQENLLRLSLPQSLAPSRRRKASASSPASGWVSRRPPAMASSAAPCSPE